MRGYPINLGLAWVRIMACDMRSKEWILADFRQMALGPDTEGM